MDSKEDFFLSEEAAEWISLLKSEYLSKLINIMGPDDFGFEEFHQFDHLIPQTLSTPDGVAEETTDQFPIRACVRSFQEKEFFYQIVVGAIIPDVNSEAKVLVPVISFVTKKDSVVKEWFQGRTLVGPILN